MNSDQALTKSNIDKMLKQLEMEEVKKQQEEFRRDAPKMLVDLAEILKEMQNEETQAASGRSPSTAKK